MPRTVVEPDLVILLQALARFTSEGVMAALDDDIRESDGYVFQHLIPGPLSIGRLAEALGVSQQAASKSVADMEARRLVLRTVDATDARTRLVALTDRAWSAVERSRKTRQQQVRRFEAALGARRMAAFDRDVRALIDAMGGAEAISQRRIRPPR